MCNEDECQGHAMKHEDFFRLHPVFSRDEFTEHLLSRGDVGLRTEEALLSYYKKAGRLAIIRRGLYATIPAGANPASFPIDPFLIAARLRNDAVLSYHTALDFHGRAHSVLEYFTYSSANPPQPFRFRSQVFRGLQFPRPLRHAGEEFFDVKSANHRGVDIWVTGLERTLVDVLNKPHISGGWEEIWRSLESIEFFDLEKVLQYVSLLDNATTAAKVGFFLEQHREALMIEEDDLRILEDLRPHQPHYLDRQKRDSGDLIPRWNLVVPREIVERRWAEVS